jgi:hypothetical protein
VTNENISQDLITLMLPSPADQIKTRAWRAISEEKPPGGSRFWFGIAVAAGQ